MDIGALEIFVYEGKRLYCKINLLTFSFFSATSNIGLLRKSNKILDSRIVTRYYFTYSVIKRNSLTKINFSIIKTQTKSNVFGSRSVTPHCYCVFFRACHANVL